METKVKKIKILNIPCDEVTFEEALEYIGDLLINEKRNQIIFLTTMGLLKARRDEQFYQLVNEAALILPINKGLVYGARFLGRGNLTLFNPFEFMIRLLRLSEKMNKSAYLVGSKIEDLEKAEKNIQVSFPGLKLVGRYPGFFPKHMEDAIVLAIRKAAPSLLLIGRGVPDKEKWLLKHKDSFHPGVYLWGGNVFEILSGKEMHPSKEVRKIKFNSPQNILKKSWRLWRILAYLYFHFLLGISKIFRIS